jgi:hypothetical protein
MPNNKLDFSINISMREIIVPNNIVDKELLNFFVGWQWLDNPTSPINRLVASLKNNQLVR